MPAALPPQRCLLAPWLPMPGLAMIHAPCGTGKTWLALAISLAVATGGSVLGWRAPGPLKVLHIDGETSIAVLRARLHALLAGAQHDPQRPDPDEPLAAPETLRFVVADALGSGVLDLMTAAGQHALGPHLADADLIVIDSLSALLGDVAEARDWRPAEEWLLALRRQGKSVLLIHHAGKGGAPLGAARQAFALDAVLALLPSDAAPPEQGPTFTLAADKLRARFDPLMHPRTVRLACADGAARWVGVEEQEYRVRRAGELADEGYSLARIGAQLNVGKTTAYRLLQRARDPFDNCPEDGGTIPPSD
jgi:hypothetical protein